MFYLFVCSDLLFSVYYCGSPLTQVVAVLSLFAKLVIMYPLFYMEQVTVGDVLLVLILVICYFLVTSCLSMALEYVAQLHMQMAKMT